MKLNILIPMAGIGSRFQAANFKESKPLIPVINGKVMIELVLENIIRFYKNDVNLICCIRKEDKEALKPILDRYNAKIIVVDKLTCGPAATCLLAKEDINSNLPLIIVNSDQFIKSFDLCDFFDKTKGYDAMLGTFFSNSPKNSYVKVENGLVTEVKEKEVISNIATSGLHYFLRGLDFVWAAEAMIDNEDFVNGEAYVAPTFQYLITVRGLRVGVCDFEGRHFPIGTPDDLAIFQKKFGEQV